MTSRSERAYSGDRIGEDRRCGTGSSSRVGRPCGGFPGGPAGALARGLGARRTVAGSGIDSVTHVFTVGCAVSGRLRIFHRIGHFFVVCRYNSRYIWGKQKQRCHGEPGSVARSAQGRAEPDHRQHTDPPAPFSWLNARTGRKEVKPRDKTLARGRSRAVIVLNVAPATQRSDP